MVRSRIKNVNESLAPGEGVFVGFGAANPVVEFTGTPNTGTVSIPLVNQGNDDNGVDDGYNLVGNPYGAAISRSSFVTANSSVTDGNIWLWSDGGQNAQIGEGRGGDYIVVNNMGAVTLDNGDMVSGTNGTYDGTNDALNSLQGFFVFAADGADGQNLTFTTDMQLSVGNADVNFFREDADVANRTSVKLSLSGQEKLTGLYNEIIVGMDEMATEGDDFSMDAQKFSGNAEISFYSLHQNKSYAIQALPTMQGAKEAIDLGYFLANAGQYRIRVEDVTLHDPSINVYLEDQKLEQLYDLSQINIIPFEITEGGTYEDRFSLIFQRGVVTSETPLRPSELEIIQASRSMLKIQYNGTREKVAIYDLQGRRQFEQIVNFADSQSEVPLTLKPDHLYLLKVGNDIIKFTVQ